MQRLALATAVEQLAWTVAREMLELEPDAGPRSDVPDADARQLWLTALSTLLAIRDSAEQLAASAALSAAQRGADYPAIGDAAGMTRQGARRKWPGLAGLADEDQRKLMWWNSRGDRLAECVRAVLATTGGQQEWPRLADLRRRLADLEKASPAQRVGAFDLLLVDAHAVAVLSPAPAGAAAPAIGLLAALTADAYAATNTHRSLVVRDDIACGVQDCPSEPVVGLLSPAGGFDAVPACHEHAVAAIREQANRIVTAYQPNAALSVFAEAAKTAGPTTHNPRHPTQHDSSGRARPAGTCQSAASMDGHDVHDNLPSWGELAAQLLTLVENRLVDPLEIILDSRSDLIRVRSRVAERVGAWALVLLGEDDTLARRTAIRLTAVLYPSDGPFDPPAEWWRTPLGRVVARRVGPPGPQAG